MVKHLAFKKRSKFAIFEAIPPIERDSISFLTDAPE